MKSSWKLGTLFGIPININYTWFIILALLTFQFATLSYPQLYPNQPAITYWIVGLATAVLLFVSVGLHELAHSVVSQAFGTPVEGITLFFFGGVASIAEDARRPRDEFLMAGAGPLASALLGAILWGLSRVASPRTYFYGLSIILAQANLALAIFNMLPGFPMDGGRVLRSLVWMATNNLRRATRIASIVGRGVAALMILAGVTLAFLLGDWASGLWLVIIGWFLENAASQSYQQLLLKETLAGLRARDLMTVDCARSDESAPLQTLVDEQMLRDGRRCILVTRGDRLAGMLTVHNVKDVPREAWPTTPAGQAMIPLEKMKTVDANATALDVLRQMDDATVNQVPVLEEGRLVGIITREQLLRVIRTRAELGA